MMAVVVAVNTIMTFSNQYRKPSLNLLSIERKKEIS